MGSGPPAVNPLGTVSSGTCVGSSYDVVKGVFERLGMVGAIVLATALIFAGIAGVVVVHRLDSAPAASTVHEQGNNSDEQGDGPSQMPPAKPAKPAKPAHPSPEPDDSQDKDA
jgi:hypothetical protein